jgi:RNA polymerase sigma-70 factor (ECF subfamily)
MPIVDYQDLESEVRRCLEGKDYAAAATLALRGLGAEIYGFLLSIHRTEDEAAEVYSFFTERFWRGLEAFHGECSIRTWAYVLARHASLNHRRDENRYKKRVRPLTNSSDLADVPVRVRSETASYLRSDRRARFDMLRRSLPPEDQTLLILRVDRGLSWNELAAVLHAGSPAPLGGQALVREAQRLRKRFQLLKERLFALGRQAGVVTVRED